MKDTDFGRKIFFLFPNSLIRNDIIFPLINMEYEVYALNDHRQIRRIDKLFRNPIVFINIDEKLSDQEWDRIISDYCNPAEEQNLKLGILSYKDNKNIILKYSNILKVSSGFHSLRQRSSDLLSNLIETLDQHKAKENRKFIRASFRDRENRFSVTVNDLERKGFINDMSSVGMTIVFDKPLRIEKNTLLQDIKLRIRESEIAVSGVFLGIQRDCDDKVVYVILFHQSMSEASRSRLKQLINRYNHEEIKDMIGAPVKGFEPLTV